MIKIELKDPRRHLGWHDLKVGGIYLVGTTTNPDNAYIAVMLCERPDQTRYLLRLETGDHYGYGNGNAGAKQLKYFPCHATLTLELK